MSKVDLKTNEEQLKRVRDAVLNDGTTKKYALFGYAESGLSNTVIVEDEGEGDGDCDGLEALLDEFHSGRYQYGLAGVKVPGKGIKHILVIWQGEGTPILRKSACAHHASDVTVFMKVTANVKCRSDDELDVESIMSVLNKSSKY